MPDDVGRWRTPFSYRQLTDDELRKVELFHFGDPWVQEGVVDQWPDGAEFIRIENRYYARDWTRCVIRNHRHKRSFTVRVRTIEGDEVLVIMGKDCGKDFTGEDWADQTGDFEWALKRQRHLRWLDGVLPLLPQLSEALGAWEKPTHKFNHHKAAFKKLDADLYRRLEFVATQLNGIMEIKERVRNTAAEIQRAERKGKSDDGEDDDEPIYVVVPVWTRRLDGLEYFTALWPSAIVKKAHSELGQIAQELAFSRLDNNQLKARRTIVRRHCNELLVAVEMMGAVNRLCRSSVLTDMATFATRDDAINGSYDYRDNKLIRSMGRRHENIVILERLVIEVPSTDLIDAVLATFEASDEKIT